MLLNLFFPLFHSGSNLKHLSIRAYLLIPIIADSNEVFCVQINILTFEMHAPSSV